MKIVVNLRTLRLVTALSFLLVTEAVGDELGKSPPRADGFVDVVQSVEPAVLPIYFQTSRGIGSGSAAIFHPDGYALTNSHVAKATSGVAVFRGQRVNFVVLGRSTEKDLAVIRFADSSYRPWRSIEFGNSDTVLNGETVAVLGNPGGRGTVVTRGVVSSKNMFFPPVSALIMTYYPDSRRDRYLQYDAATNMGNSGGPVIDMDGKIIGVVAALLNREQNTSFAIPVTRVREYLPVMFGSELSYLRWVGIHLDPMEKLPKVKKVDPGSPAHAAKIVEGDIIRSLNGNRIDGPIDWLVRLDQALQNEDEISLSIDRGDASIAVDLKTQAWPIAEPEKVNATEQGLAYDLHKGQFRALPDFAKLPVFRSGAVSAFDLDAVSSKPEDSYAIRFSGFLKIDKQGLYRITVTSDDGTRLWVGGSNLIDHDGVHPPMAASQLVRMKAGMHPIVLEYFQSSGNASLEFKLELLQTPADFQTTELKPQLYHLPATTKGL